MDVTRRNLIKSSAAAVVGASIASSTIAGGTILSGCDKNMNENKRSRFKSVSTKKINNKKDNSKSILIKGGQVLNVFTGELETKNVLIKGDMIDAVGNYDKADNIIDAKGKIIVPSFIDSHMHIESTHLTPPEFSKIVVPHGTGAVVTDPHEIANICGVDGIQYMMQTSVGLPMDVYFTLPSCVPASKFDESGANLSADDLYPLYEYENVVGLSEVMDFPAVINREESVMKKIEDAKNNKVIVCGHAPALRGDDLQKYVAAGIVDDHECSSFEEALDKLNCGQTIIIREGSSAKNLSNLAGLFDKKYCSNCVFCTDDKTAADLISDGHIDSIIRLAIKNGCKPAQAIIMATIQAARHYNIPYIGAVSPGYYANLNIVDSIDNVNVETVLHKGDVVYDSGKMAEFEIPQADSNIQKRVRATFNIKDLNANDFKIDIPSGKKIRAIEVISNEILTKEKIIDPSQDQDLIKIAVCERHNNTGHIGLGYLYNTGMNRGAIASSYSHDSHNLITFGKSDEDMALAANTVKQIGGGMCVVVNGEVTFKQELPIAGALSDNDGAETARINAEIMDCANKLGFKDGIDPFMTTSFCSLSVIPELRLTTKGLVNVNTQEQVDLFV